MSSQSAVIPTPFLGGSIFKLEDYRYPGSHDSCREFTHSKNQYFKNGLSFWIRAPLKDEGFDEEESELQICKDNGDIYESDVVVNDPVIVSESLGDLYQVFEESLNYMAKVVHDEVHERIKERNEDTTFDCNAGTFKLTSTAPMTKESGAWRNKDEREDLASQIRAMTISTPEIHTGVQLTSKWIGLEAEINGQSVMIFPSVVIMPNGSVHSHTDDLFIADWVPFNEGIISAIENWEHLPGPEWGTFLQKTFHGVQKFYDQIEHDLEDELAVEQVKPASSGQDVDMMEC